MPINPYAMTLIGTLLISSEAHAQAEDTGTSSTRAATAAEASALPGDIIVTAQRRSQRLSDVGITISAASGAELQTAGVKDIADLPKIAPGISTGYSYLGYAIFSIRGINFNANQLAAAPAASVYLDEASLPYAPMTDGLLFDVERVEVIKGPQGTLFGQNATGGSINVIAAKPTSDTKAGFQIEANHFGQVNLEGFVSGPLSDNVRVRVAATTTQFGAWQKGYYLTPPSVKNGDANRLAGRAIVDWDVTSKTNVQLTLAGNYNHGQAQQPQLSLPNPSVPSDAVAGLTSYRLPNDNRDVDITPGLNTHMRNRQYQAVLRITSRLSDDLTLTSVSNYVNFKTRQNIEVDAVVPDLGYISTNSSVETFSQEVRVNGQAAAGAITYIFGGNYQKDIIYENLLETYNRVTGLPRNTVFDLHNKITSQSLGVFANVDWEFLPKLTLTAGGRYTESKQSRSGCFSGNAPAAATLEFISSLLRGSPPPAGAFMPGASCITINDIDPSANFLPTAVRLKNSENNVSWRAGLNFKPNSDTLLYGLVSRGYKAGGYPVQIDLLASQINHARQEKLTSYEVGAKLAFNNRKFQVNGALFYYDFVDKQFITYLPSIIGSLSTLANIPKSTVKGAELEVRANPLTGLTISGAATYIKTRVGKFQGYDISLRPSNFEDNEFNFAPPWTATFDAEYEFPIGGRLNAYAGGGGSYNSRTFADLGGSATSRIPSRAIFDARMGVRSDAGWRFGIWVRNLTDKYYWTSVNGGADTLMKYAGMPRTFGATFAANF